MARTRACVLLATLPALVECKSSLCPDFSDPNDECICEDQTRVALDECFPDSLRAAHPVSMTLSEGPWEGWGVNYGELTAESDPSALHHFAPPEGRTSYLLGSMAALESLNGADAMHFQRKLVTEWQYETYDVVIRSGDAIAARPIPKAPDAEWQSFTVSLDDDEGWYADDPGLRAIVDSATSLEIRAEFTSGADEMWLSDFRVSN